MRSQKIQHYFDKLQALNNKASEIKRSPKLTRLGQRDELKKLEGDRTILRIAAHGGFKFEWDDIRTQFKQNAVKRESALKAERARWDYNALAYETKNIVNIIERAGDVKSLNDAFSQAKQDPLLVRAWGDALQSRLNVFPNMKQDVEQLRRDVMLEVQRVRTTPELQKVDEAGKALADRAAELYEDTRTFSNLMDGTGAVGRSANEFDELLQGVAVKRDYEGEAGFKVTVNIS